MEIKHHDEADRWKGSASSGKIKTFAGDTVAAHVAGDTPLRAGLLTVASPDTIRLATLRVEAEVGRGGG